jgi:hypothetical protein
MPRMPGGACLPMRLHQAPFALLSDGTVVINVCQFDDASSVEQAIAVAMKARGHIFIGLTVRGTEVLRVLGGLAHAHREAAASLAGRRQRRPP